MNKKAFILHPVTWIVVAFFLGFLVAYLIAQQIIPLNLPLCPVAAK